jgi:Glycosyl transferases group 1
MIEAMACGTPVIAFRAGSVPEVIEDGLTGLIVEREDEAVQADHRLQELDRRKVRARFEERFAATRMAEDGGRLCCALSSNGRTDGTAVDCQLIDIWRLAANRAGRPRRVHSRTGPGAELTMESVRPRFCV